MEIKEIWKDIPNYEGYYQVSNLGNVKSIRFNREKLLKKCVNSFGYCLVVLYKNKKRKIFYVHQLVAIAFLNHKPNRFEKVVNHKNFNKLDNRVENLEIVSHRENCNQKHIKSSSNCTGVSFNNTEKCFFSYIRIKSNLIHLGKYKSEKKLVKCMSQL